MGKREYKFKLSSGEYIIGSIDGELAEVEKLLVKGDVFKIYVSRYNKDALINPDHIEAVEPREDRK